MKFARNALLVAATSAVRYQSATAFAPSSGIAAKTFGPRVFVPAEQSSTSVAGVRTFLRRTFGSSATTSTAVITHNAGISQMADRVVQLADGRVGEVIRNETRLPPSELSW